MLQKQPHNYRWRCCTRKMSSMPVVAWGVIVAAHTTRRAYSTSTSTDHHRLSQRRVWQMEISCRFMSAEFALLFSGKSHYIFGVNTSNKQTNITYHTVYEHTSTQTTGRRATDTYDVPIDDYSVPRISIKWCAPWLRHRNFNLNK